MTALASEVVYINLHWSWGMDNDVPLFCVGVIIN